MTTSDGSKKPSNKLYALYAALRDGNLPARRRAVGLLLTISQTRQQCFGIVNERFVHLLVQRLHEDGMMSAGILCILANLSQDVKCVSQLVDEGVLPALVRCALGKEGITTAGYFQGSRVKAQFLRSDSKWTKKYRGVVLAVNGDGSYQILYEDGDIMGAVPTHRMDEDPDDPIHGEINQARLVTLLQAKPLHSSVVLDSEHQDVTIVGVPEKPAPRRPLFCTEIEVQHARSMFCSCAFFQRVSVVALASLASLIRPDTTQWNSFLVLGGVEVLLVLRHYMRCDCHLVLTKTNEEIVQGMVWKGGRNEAAGQLSPVLSPSMGKRDRPASGKRKGQEAPEVRTVLMEAVKPALERLKQCRNIHRLSHHRDRRIAKWKEDREEGAQDFLRQRKQKEDKKQQLLLSKLEDQRKVQQRHSLLVQQQQKIAQQQKMHQSKAKDDKKVAKNQRTKAKVDGETQIEDRIKDRVAELEAEKLKKKKGKKDKKALKKIKKEAEEQAAKEAKKEIKELKHQINEQAKQANRVFVESTTRAELIAQLVKKQPKGASTSTLVVIPVEECSADKDDSSGTALVVVDGAADGAADDKVGDGAGDEAEGGAQNQLVVHDGDTNDGSDPTTDVVLLGSVSGGAAGYAGYLELSSTEWKLAGEALDAWRQEEAELAECVRQRNGELQEARQQLRDAQRQARALHRSSSVPEGAVTLETRLRAANLLALARREAKASEIMAQRHEQMERARKLKYKADVRWRVQEEKLRKTIESGVGAIQQSVESDGIDFVLWQQANPTAAEKRRAEMEAAMQRTGAEYEAMRQREREGDELRRMRWEEMGQRKWELLIWPPEDETARRARIDQAQAQRNKEKVKRAMKVALFEEKKRAIYKSLGNKKAREQKHIVDRVKAGGEANKKLKNDQRDAKLMQDHKAKNPKIGNEAELEKIAQREAKLAAERELAAEIRRMETEDEFSRRLRLELYAEERRQRELEKEELEKEKEEMKEEKKRRKLEKEQKKKDKEAKKEAKKAKKKAEERTKRRLEYAKQVQDEKWAKEQARLEKVQGGPSTDILLKKGLIRESLSSY
jgi:hypothetical protein